MATIDSLDIQISAQVGRSLDSLRRLSRQLDTVNTGLGRIASNSGFTRISLATRNVTSNFSKMGKSIDSSGNGVGRLVKRFLSLAAAMKGIKKLWGSIGTAMDYVETLNYFNAAFQQVAENADLSAWKEAGSESAEAYANSFRDRAKELTQKLTGFEVSDTGELTRTSTPSLGLDPDKTMQYQATFAQMTSSMGATSDAAVKVSNALTMIGADLASVRNMDFDRVWEDMASGLAGMSRTLDKYGVNIRNVNLQQKLNSLGIDESITKINQQDKALLRTIILLESTKYAWGDLSKTINQPANQVRLLTANLKSLSRTIGSLFIPILTKVLPYINAFVIALQRLFSWIAKTLGIKLSDFTASMGGMSDAAGGLLDGMDESEGLDGMEDSADKAASAVDKTTDSVKDLEKSLSVLSFDELNQLSGTKKDAGADADSELATPDSGVDNNIPDYSDILGSALDDALSNYLDAWNKAFGEMENKANEIADKIVKAFKKIADAAKPTTAAIKKLWNEGFKKLGDFTWDTIKDFWNNFLKPIGNWILSDGSGLPRFFDITNDLLNEIDWGKLNKSLEEFFTSLQKPTKFVWTALMDFYEHFLKPVAVWTMSEAIPQLVDALTEFNNNIHWEELNAALVNFWDALAPFAKSVGQGLVNFFKDLLSVGADFINKVVPGGLNSLAEALRGIKPETAEKVGWALGELLVAITGFKAIGWIDGVLGEKGALGKGLALLARHPYLTIAAGIGGVVLALDKFGVIDVDWDWLWSKLGQIKDILLEFIQKVDFNALGDALGNLWSAFQPFAKGFADELIDAFNTLLNDIGVPLLNSLVGIFNGLGKALGKMDPDDLYNLGKSLVEVAIAIKTIKLTKATVDLIAGLAGSFRLLGTALGGGALASTVSSTGRAASSASKLWGLLGLAVKPLSAILFGVTGGMEMTLESLNKAEDPIKNAEGLFGNLSNAVKILGESGSVSREEQSRLIDQIDKLEGKGQLTGATVTGLADSLHRAGISSGELKDAAEKAGVDIGVLSEEMRALEGISSSAKTGLDNVGDSAGTARDNLGGLAEKAGNTKSILDEIDTSGIKTKLDETGGAAKSAGDKIEGLGGKTQGTQSIVNTLNLDPAKNTVKSLQDEISKADYSHLPKETLDAAAGTKSVWDTQGGEIKKSIYNALYNNISPLGEQLKTRFSGWAVLSVSGYTKKIKELESGADRAMRDFADRGLIAPTKSELGINSPSKVFEGFGENVVAGLKNGIDDKASTATSSIETLGSGLQTALGKHLKNIETSADTTMGNLGKSFTNAETNASTAAGKISGAFSNIKIPLPHLEVIWDNWSIGDLQFSVPKFSINWYAKGGLFTGTSVIGVGEAGREAVLPLENQRTMKMIANAILDGMSFGAKESPFLENIALYTQKTATWCEQLLSLFGMQRSDYRDESGRILGAMGDIGKAIGDTTQNADKILNGIIEGVSNILNGIWEKLASGLNNGFALLNASISNIPAAMSEIASSIISAINALPANINICSGTETGKKIRSASAKALSKTKWSGGKSPNDIFKLAKGGLVKGPILTHIGENYKPEAVLPLTDTRAMAQIAESIYANAPEGGVGLTKEEVKEAVIEGVVMAMMNNQQNQPPVNVYATLKTENDEVLARTVMRGMRNIDYRYSPA